MKRVAWLEQRADWIGGLLLLLFFARLLDAAVRQSVTFDETLHVFQGVLYWREEALYAVVRNPPLVNALIGLPANWLARPSLPPDLARYADQDWLAISKTFMWEVNRNGLLLVWAGRLAIITLSLWLAALVYRWSGRLAGSRTAGLLALVLITFDPNILAHGALATTDLGFTFFFVLAGYALWRYWTAFDRGRPHIRLGVLSGIATGLACAAKFSGLVLVFALLIMTGLRYATLRPRRPNIVRAAAGLAGILLLAAFTLLTIYRFQTDTLRLDFVLQQAHQLEGHSAYLLGELSRSGWWYYLPLLFLVKTPLPVLLLLSWSAWRTVQQRDFGWAVLWPLLLAAGIFAAALLSRASIGYRYLLPALPLLYISAGRALRPAAAPGRPSFVPASIGWLTVVSLALHPHYLAFFNLLAGGPQNGWRVAVDSNIDWGQDLGRLRDIAAERGSTAVYASWLGTAPLAVYEIPGQTLDGWPWPAEDPLRDPLYPPQPAPGLYALSVTQLMGVYLDKPDQFAWFRARPPAEKAGYSIFVYDVPAQGPPAGLGVSGIALATLDPADFEQAFSGNNVRTAWFDARRSLLWAGGGGEHAWTAVGDGHIPVSPSLRRLYPVQGSDLRGQGEDGLAYQLFSWPQRPSLPDARDHTAEFGELLRLEQTEQVNEAVTPGQTVELLTAWSVLTDLPYDTSQLSLFLHLLDPKGQLVAQHDGLDVALGGLRKGDWFAQQHTFSVPPDLPPGEYTLRIGVYDPLSGARQPLAGAGADSLIVGVLRVAGT